MSKVTKLENGGRAAYRVLNHRGGELASTDLFLNDDGTWILYPPTSHAGPRVGRLSDLDDDDLRAIRACIDAALGDRNVNAHVKPAPGLEEIDLSKIRVTPTGQVQPAEESTTGVRVPEGCQTLVAEVSDEEPDAPCEHPFEKCTVMFHGEAMLNGGPEPITIKCEACGQDHVHPAGWPRPVLDAIGESITAVK